MITKEDYLDFANCEKKLWIKKDSSKPITEFAKQERKWLSNLKKKVQERFSENVIIDPTDVVKAVSDTQIAIDKGIPAIFNATFKIQDLILVVDFLNKKGDVWQVVSIKNTLSNNLYSFIKSDSSSKEVKAFLKEIAFTKYVLDKVQYTEMRNVSYCIMTLNSNYIREDDLDLIQLTKIFNLDKHIQNADVEEMDAVLDKIRTQKSEPEVMIGSHCKNPDCSFRDICWKNITEESIHNIPRITQTKRELFVKNGWHTINDIQDLENNLTDIQRSVVQKVKVGTVRKNQMKLLFFTNRLKYPLYHLDFETIFPNIPLYKGMKPLDPLPFQYSLHIEDRNKPLVEKSFIHKENSDPRLEFIKSLIVNLGTDGSIIVYNKGFESNVINLLALAFPEYAQELKKIDARLVDLMIPFKEQDYWHPKMVFSYSLKAVLPALVPEMTYKNFNIQNGEQALLAYERFLESTDEKEREQIINDLIIYCSQDTMAMVKILEVIRKK